MALLQILEFPDPRLRTRAQSVTQIDAALRTLIDDMFETMYAAPGIGLAATQVKDGRPLPQDPAWRDRMAALEIEIDAVEMNELSFYSSLKTGEAPGLMASVVKMRGTEVGQKVTELAVEAVANYAQPFTELRNFESNIVPVGGEYVDDAAVTTAVKSKFVEAKTVDASSIHVETLQGEVMLSGFAKNATEKADAERLAREVKGVKRVKNEIAIRN